MPVKIYEYHRQPDVLAVPLEENIECNIVLAYLKKKDLPKDAVTFVDFIRQVVLNGKP
jgi:hypothetical protein